MKKVLLILSLLAGCEPVLADRLWTEGYETWGTIASATAYKNNGSLSWNSTTAFGGLQSISSGRARSLYSGTYQITSSFRNQTVTGNIFTMTGTRLYCRVWANFSSATPSVDEIVWGVTNGVNDDIELRWCHSGKISIGRNGVFGDSTTAVFAGGYHLFKIYSSWKGSSDTVYCIADAMGSPQTLYYLTAHTGAKPNGAAAGALGPTPTANNACIIGFDDLAVNDDAGSYENYWPDDTASVIYLPPQADNAKGNWTNGSGGTTNLYQNVNLVPPGGSNTDNSVITNTTSSASDNFDVDCQQVNNYLDVSNNPIPSGNAIRLMFAFARTGEHGASGTEAGAVALITNPTQSSETSFNFGNDGGAHFTDAQNSATLQWYSSLGTTQYWPTVNRSSVTTVRVGRRTANTNRICVDQMGVIMEIGSHTGEPSNASNRKKFIN